MNSGNIYWILALTVVSLTALMIGYHYNELPEQVPMHFNLQGEPDRLGSRTELFLLPAIGFVLLALLYKLKRKALKINPHKFGVRTEQQLYITRILMGQLSLFTSAILGWAAYSSMAVAIGQQTRLSALFLWIFLGGFLVIFGYYLFAIYKTTEN